MRELGAVVTEEDGAEEEGTGEGVSTSGLDGEKVSAADPGAAEELEDAA